MYNKGDEHLVKNKMKKKWCRTRFSFYFQHSIPFILCHSTSQILGNYHAFNQI